MEECPSLDPLRHPHAQPLCTEVFWDRPEPSVVFLRSAGLLDQSWREATQQEQLVSLIKANIFLPMFFFSLIKAYIFLPTFFF